MVYEEYPGRYGADVSRRHRWIRGDWQLLRWLLPGVPGPDGRRQQEPALAVSRWKLFDNLRRSLVPAALTLLLLLGWTVLPSPWFWTVAVIGVVVLPLLLSTLLDLVAKAGRSAVLGSMRPPWGAPPPGVSSRPSSRWRSSRTRRFSAWMRLCAPRGGCWSRTGDSWNGARRATRTAAAAGPGGPRRLVPDHVDRTGHGRRSGDPPGAFGAGGSGRGRPPAGPLVLLARRRVADQPAAGPRRGAG